MRELNKCTEVLQTDGNHESLEVVHECVLTRKLYKQAVCTFACLHIKISNVWQVLAEAISKVLD